MPLVPEPINCDISVKRAIQLLSKKLGYTGTPVFTSIALTGLIASRLIAADGDKAFESVSDLTTWIAGTANQIVVTDDGDGTITLSLPADLQSWEGGSSDVTLDTLHLSVGQPLHTGDSPIFADLKLTGRVSSGTLTFSTVGPTDNVDVSGINTLFIDNSSNVVTIGGFSGGVDGQVLHITLINPGNNNVTLEHNHTGATQKIFLHAGADETLKLEYGGWVFICHNGVDWHDCSHEKHV